MKNFAMLAIVGLASSAAMAQNTGAILTNGPHAFNFGGTGFSTPSTLPTASTGANPSMDFRVGSNTQRNIFTGYWYYRVGTDTRERNFNSAATRTLTGTSRVDYTYTSIFGTGGTAVAGLSGGLSYELFNISASSACLVTIATITNSGNAPVSLSLFGANDVDLGGNNANGFGGDVVSPLDLSGGNRTWIVNDTGATTAGPWSMRYVGFGATGAGVGGFSAINGQMTDTNVDNFVPDLNAAGLAAGDYAEVMQWDLTIPAGESRTVTLAIAIANNGETPTVVPTPGAAALLGLGGLAAMRRRRN